MSVPSEVRRAAPRAMRVALTVALPDHPRVDVVVATDDDTAVSALADALARATGAPVAPLYVDGTVLSPDALLRDTGLVDGCVVGLGVPAVPRARSRVAGWQLHVVGGPDAGLVRDLPPGRHEVGRGGQFGLTDTCVSRRHALLTVAPEGVTVADLGSANGTHVEGRPAPTEGEAPAARVGQGQLLTLGDTLLRVVPATAPDAAVEDGAAPGTLSFVRPPRLLPSDRQVRVVLPTAPEDRPARRLPVAALVAPAALSLVMAVVMRNPLYLLLALASPVLALSTFVSDRRQSGREAKEREARYRQELADAQQQLREALETEKLRRRFTHPDPAAVLLTATGPTKRLWQRRRTDPDALVLRLGAADLPATVVVERVRSGAARGTEPPRLLHAVPATVPLREVGVLGVAGPEEQVQGLLRWLVLQLAVHHAPRDLGITLLAPAARRSWSWVRWLPQARVGEGDGPAVSVGNDEATIAARVAELTALVKSRREVAAAAGRVPPEYFPAQVLVLDGSRALRVTPGLAQVLKDGPGVGVYAVCGDDQERFLPEECTATALFLPDDPAYLRLHRNGTDTVHHVLADQVVEAVADTAARALAPLRDRTSDDGELVLPDSVRLLDVLGMEPPTVDGVRARWQLGGRSTVMALGAGLDGTFTLDLRRDGPHALIAGTTGAGKSELLQSMIASLAVANRPDALNFVLVDYKGGSAFKDCVALPHTVGMVTDLDAHLVERALTSLGAELKFREHWLAEAGVKDIEDYVDLQAREPHRPPLPRLVLVIDEFASMARELPDFVTGLVNIAQRGRSLGIHLVLATQRPSGVVSPEIRANTNLRIALRVTDKTDSTDVIDAPDSARIPKSAAGRGFARLGQGALVAFQAGRVGGRRPGVRPARTPVPFVATLAWSQLGYTAPQPPRVAEQDDVDLTDLAVLVDAVREAAAAERVPAQRSPWLAALPDRLLLEEAAEPPGAPAGAGEPALPPLAFGLQDLPAVQQRRVAAFQPVRDGHLLVVGGPRSGRSQVLRALAASVGRHCSTADVHVFGLDCGNGALLPVQALPHCGAVVSRNQTERAVRLLDRLAAEVERRQTLLAEGGFADVAEQRRGSDPAERLPHVLLLLDRWEGFLTGLGEVDGGRLTDLVLTLLREGASAGVHLVVTGDSSLAKGRISSLTDNKLVLRLSDRADYALLGLNPRQLPDSIPAGRGFTAGEGVETQVALLADDESAQGQAAVLAGVAAAARDRDTRVPRHRRPFRLDVLPSRLTWQQAWELRPEAASALFGLVGVGGDELIGLGPDFAVGGPAFVVGGPAKSGRSTALAVLARSLLASGTAVVLGAPRPSPLRGLGGAEGVLALVDDAEAPAEHWRDALAAAGGRPVVVVLDDAELLRDCPGAEVFRDLVKGRLGPERFLVLGGNAEGICTGLSGWQVEAKKSRQGLLLSPQSGTDGDLVGLRLPRSVVGQAVQPGRGLLHLGDSRLVSVAVPAL